MPWVASEPIRITVPGIPKPLGRQRHSIRQRKDGSRFVHNHMPTSSANEQANIRSFAWLAMGNRPPIDQAVELRMIIYRPIPASWSKKKQAAALADQVRPTGKPDWSNFAKMEDALCGLVFRDDALVTDADMKKRYSSNPRWEIEVRALTWRD